MPRRNRNRYAAIAAVRRGDWKAVTDDTLDLLSAVQLHELSSEMGRHKAPDWLLQKVADERKRAEIYEMHAMEMQQ